MMRAYFEPRVFPQIPRGPVGKPIGPSYIPVSFFISSFLCFIPCTNWEMDYPQWCDTCTALQGN